MFILYKLNTNVSLYRFIILIFRSHAEPKHNPTESNMRNFVKYSCIYGSILNNSPTFVHDRAQLNT